MRNEPMFHPMQRWFLASVLATVAAGASVAFASDGDERLAFVVARAIKRRGFRAQPYLRPALLGATPRIQTIFQSRILEALQQAGGTV